MTKKFRYGLLSGLFVALIASLAFFFLTVTPASAATNEGLTIYEIDEKYLPNDLQSLEKNDGSEYPDNRYFFINASDFVDNEVVLNGPQLSITISNRKIDYSIIGYQKATIELQTGTYYCFTTLKTESVTSINVNGTPATGATELIKYSDTFDGIIPEPEDPAADEGTIFDKASEWLQTNTGIAISSGGIVVIGVIILLLIFTKRR